ncbi:MULTISPECIES: hypothetical protein [Agrobacterium]|uniref:hypothetical protein n=1 Tax=Agrobacterium TaxID=357 RepID=UPI0015749864|nr:MULTISPECIES: hypothetical protein [Agrobacterium]MBO9108021.1 hypothetical protein [Agrobacterium sp. S2/73]QXZ71386.1 hypothetical protein J5276_09720 [Agrobacterium sp. S7/73]WCK71487.1 hypothetical protein G6L96_003195 [Agrobacterium tumefaciens]
MDYDYERSGYKDFLRQLIDGGDINDDAAEGITKKVIGEGEESLSDKQRYVFNTKVKSVFLRPKCSLCEQPVEWDIAYEELGSSNPRCSSCNYRYEKMLEE